MGLLEEAKKEEVVSARGFEFEDDEREAAQELKSKGWSYNAIVEWFKEREIEVPKSALQKEFAQKRGPNARTQGGKKKGN